MGKIVILGVFNADTTYRADRQPKIGETIHGHSFSLGPGGKGSNQAVAAARAGGEVHFISRLGQDAFADMARGIWAKAGVHPEITVDPDRHTGAAYIFVEAATGNNAIIIAPGAAAQLSAADLDARAGLIGSAQVFVTQFEQPMEAAQRGLEIAKGKGVRTILNPAPARGIPPDMLALTDYLTPNETEAEGITGIPVNGPDGARKAAEKLVAQGVGAVIVTLGAQGALYHDGRLTLHVPVISAGPVVETTGAGDAFNGGLAVALSEGQPPEAALRFAAATAAISVTRPGAAPSMPARAEIDALLRKA